MQDEQIMLV